MKAYLYWGIVLTLGIALLLVVTSCSTKKAIEVKPMSVSTVTINTPPGALPEVPPEKGGNGFEKIAAAQGWQTKAEADIPMVIDSNARKGGIIRLSMMEFPTNLRHEGKDANTVLNRMLASMTYESLLGMDMIQEYVPNLADYWKISDDKLTFWFHINPRARWADGSRVTSEDVIATWKLNVDPGIIDAYENQLFSKYDEPVAESPYIVRVHTKELNWRHFMYFIGMSILPKKELDQLDGPFYSDWVKTAKKGEQPPKTKGSDYLTKYQFKMFMGSGSYVIRNEDIQKDVSITLTRRNDYWDKDSKGSKYGSNFDKIKFLVVKDENLTKEKFKKGEIDVYPIGRAQWWKEEFNFENVQKGLIQKRKVYNYEAQGINGFVFNMRREPFNDIRVRQAVAMLINRDKLIEKLFFNEYIKLYSFFPATIYANPNDQKIEFNPDAAVKLLAEAGYNKRDNEGTLMKGNKKFELDVMFTSPSEERYLTVVQEDLQKGGIKINLKQTTGATAFSMINERKFDMYFMNWSGLQFPNPESSMRSNTADSLYTTNTPGLKDKRIDELCDEYNICFEMKRRIEIIREIDSIAVSKTPYAFGWYGPYIRLVYWNKFSMPASIFSRTGDFYDCIALWSYDPEKDAKLQEALKDPSKKLPVGEVENKFWIDWTKKNEKLVTGQL